MCGTSLLLNKASSFKSAQWFVPPQASESGSADDPHSAVLEWQEMASEAVSSRDQARQEKASMALRISHLEEEREGKGGSTTPSAGRPGTWSERSTLPSPPVSVWVPLNSPCFPERSL